MEVVSRAGKKKYVSYVFDKLSVCATKEYWRCELMNNGCKCCIHISNDVIIKQINNHSHDSNAAKVEVDCFRGKIKIRARETMEQTCQVINACLNEADLSQATQAALPKNAVLKKMIRRTRNVINAAPPAPLRIELLMIPDEYKLFKHNGIAENFLRADSGLEPDRILIFGREKNIHKVSISTDIQKYAA
ncbi:unnamed protein product [Psylliodes chrysocephalus]|uniref:FLYWCH-type domain-containing protein n=1 Tax=Psylliodes chrysocephalus TaxID=3402493 RepID=A0A9P0DDS4_9CUCU|nr:unnamed protein product [Psylliodes chrysocephala]